MLIFLCLALFYGLTWAHSKFPAGAANLRLVNPLIGNTGPEPNFAGGMIPSVAPPFGMTRWVAQTQQNWVSRLPYNYSDSDIIHGFVGTHQPAIWMGESGLVAVVPGVSPANDGKVNALFEERGLRRSTGSEKFGVSLYKVDLETKNSGTIRAEMTATSRVSFLRFTFNTDSKSHPYILIQASRPSTLFHSTPTSSHFNQSYPDGFVRVYSANKQICGYNSEMQDWVIAPVSNAAHVKQQKRDGTGHGGYKGWFCARFDTAFDEFGIVQGTVQRNGAEDGFGPELSAFARFEYQGDSQKLVVNVRIATSFISMDQALINLEREIPDELTLEQIELETREAWEEKLGRVEVEGGTLDNQTVLMTSVFHALQYPYEVHEYGHYYSAYDDLVHEGESYNGYSIWDTYRAEWGFLLLFAPERVPGMIQSMLQDYQQGGWLPMWKNIIETNIMISTHADSLISEAVLKGFVTGFDISLAWEAVWKDATTPPARDWEVRYEDREEGIDYEVRAGLSSSYAVPGKGWVNDDVHSESVSRTLGYAYDDYALARLAQHLNKSDNVIRFLHDRAMKAPWLIWNDDATSSGDYTTEEDRLRFRNMTKGFVQARNANGSWAEHTSGFTEGDKWAYSFDIVHDISTLIKRRGGKTAFVKSLEEHYEGGWDWFGNEPSHHIPYLYALAGRPDLTQKRVREIVGANFNATPQGLSGNEDCGQMSAWFIFGALGFYPVNPVSKEYVFGSPFFDKLTIHLPVPEHLNPDQDPIFYDVVTHSYVLTVEATGAPTSPYVESIYVNGRSRDGPMVGWDEISRGGSIRFAMTSVPSTSLNSDQELIHEEL